MNSSAESSLHPGWRVPRPRKLARAAEELHPPDDSAVHFLPEGFGAPAAPDNASETPPADITVDEDALHARLLEQGGAEIAGVPSVMDQAKRKSAAKGASPTPPAKSAFWWRACIAIAIGAALALLVAAAQNTRRIPTFHLRAPVGLVAKFVAPFKSARAALVRHLANHTGPASDFPKVWPGLIFLLGLVGTVAATGPARVAAVAMRIGRFRWDLNDFCRGWLVTGATGSGKTAAAIVFMIHAVCQAMRRTSERAPWGGVCIDEKGLFYQTFVPILQNYGRGDDVLLLQVPTEDEASYVDWEDPALVAGQPLMPFPAQPAGKPAVRFNLLSDDRVLSGTYAQVICDTARTAQGSGKGGESNPVFPVTAQISIRIMIDVCRAIAAREAETNPSLSPAERFTPNLRRIYQLLSSRSLFDEMMVERGVWVKGEGVEPPTKKGETPRPIYQAGPLLQGNTTEALLRLERFLKEITGTYFDLPKDTFGGVKMNALSYLAYFNQDQIAAVFCDDCTFSFDDLDQGKILFLAMPQKYRVERRYVAAIIKLLTYQHVLARFDLPLAELRKRNVIIVWADEAQRTVGEDDGNVDIFREAKCAVVLATQMQSSLWKNLGGREPANVIIGNLRSRFAFEAASEECAEATAQFLGKTKKRKLSWSRGRGGRSTNISEAIEYKVEPYQLRNEMRKFEAYVVHSGGGFRKMVVPCLDAQGDEQDWWLKDIAFRHPIVFVRHWLGRTGRRLGRRMRAIAAARKAKAAQN